MFFAKQNSASKVDAEDDIPISDIRDPSTRVDRKMQMFRDGNSTIEDSKIPTIEYKAGEARETMVDPWKLRTMCLPFGVHNIQQLCTSFELGHTREGKPETNFIKRNKSKKALLETSKAALAEKATQIVLELDRRYFLAQERRAIYIDEMLTRKLLATKVKLDHVVIFCTTQTRDRILYSKPFYTNTYSYFKIQIK